MTIHLISTFLIFVMTPSYGTNFTAQEINLSKAIGKKVSTIGIEGNKKTKIKTIRRELDFSLENKITQDKVKNSLRKLKNLIIFDDVNIKFYTTKTNKIRISVIIGEKWTVIPIAKFGGGGGSQYYTIGVYDVNAFGKFIEFGSQYQNINGKSGGVLWFRNPRFLDQRLTLGVDLWDFMLNQPLYDADGELSGAYNNTRSRIHLFTKKQLSRWVFIGSGIDYVVNKYDVFGLTDEQIIVNETTNFQVPEDGKQNFIELNMQFGELNYDHFLVEGFQTNINARITSKQLLSDEDSADIVIKNTYFEKFKYQQNIGINFVFGHTTSQLLQNQFYLGGLLEVRGFVDRRFRGSDYWKSNLEYRVPSYRSPWFVLQHVAFIDFGQISNSAANLFANEKTSFASIGTGLRFISPKIYRFNARIDIARTLGSDPKFDISAGLQQFF